MASKEFEEYLKRYNEGGYESTIPSQPNIQESTRPLPLQRVNVPTTRDTYLSSPQAQSIVRPIGAFGSSAANAATMGMLNVFQQKSSPELYETSKQLQQEYPKTSFVGELSGSLVPFGLAGKAVKGISALANPAVRAIDRITQTAAKGALEVAPISAIQGGSRSLEEGKQFPDVLQDATIGGLGGALFGGALGAAGKGIGEGYKYFKNLPKYEKMVEPAVNYRPSSGISTYENQVTPMGKRYTYKTPAVKNLDGQVPERYKQSMQSLPSLNEQLMLPAPKGTYLKPLENKMYSAKLVDTPTTETMRIINNKPATLKSDIPISSYSNLSRQELSQVKNELLNEKGKIFSEQLDFLNSKASRGNKPNQGGVGKDSEGNVVSRFGRISNNEAWYQQWAKENSYWDDVKKKWIYRKPSQVELKEIADKQLKEGFGSNSGNIPKNDYYNTIDERLKAIDELLNSAENKFPRNFNISQIKEADITTLQKQPSFSINEKINKLKELKNSRNPYYVEPQFRLEKAGLPRLNTIGTNSNVQQSILKPLNSSEGQIIPQTKIESIKTQNTAPKYSPETQSKLDELDSIYKQQVNNTKTLNFMDSQTQQKQLMGMAMKNSAAKREIIQGESLISVEGGLTQKELANKINKLKSNYSGKEVTTPDGDGIVTGKMSFGKVEVDVNGSKKYYTTEQVQSKVDIDAQINAQKQALNAPKVESSMNSPVIANVSSRNLPKISEMTKSEFDSYYGLDKKPSLKSVETMIEDTGRKVINKVGSSDVQTIINYYKNKYNIPENIKINFNNNKGMSKGSTVSISDPTGNLKSYRVSINSNQSPEGIIGTLRHEIEHIIDLKNGYTPKINKFELKPASTGRTLYEQTSRGHHKQYGWFEADYIRRASIKDALKSGEKVRDEVLNEFPDLKNIVPKIDSNIPVQPPTNRIMRNIESGNVKQRKFISNSYLSPKTKIITPSMKAEMRTKIPEYNEITNKATLDEANKIIGDDIEKHAREFLQNDKLDTALETAKGISLIQKSIAKGNIALANDISVNMAEKATTAGQSIQALSIMKRMTPEGMLQYGNKQLQKWNKLNPDKTPLNFSEAETDLIVNNMNQISKSNNDIIGQKFELKLFNDTKLAEIMELIGRKIPSDLGQKLRGIQRINLLLNPKTMVRNVTGNVITGGLGNLSDTLRAGIDKGIGAITGKRTALLPNLGELLSGAKQGFKRVLSDFKKRR
jgi:hypothetical protein